MLAVDWPAPAGNASVSLAEPRAAAGAKAGDTGAAPGEEAAARLPQRWTVRKAGARSPSPGSLGDGGLPSSVNQCGLVV